MLPNDFIDMLLPKVVDIQLQYGLPGAVLLSQFANETGWGEHIAKDYITKKDSKNLGNLKGTNGTNGYVTIWTSEYMNGIKVPVLAKFRAYNTYDEAIIDYVKLITQSPRYLPAMNVRNNPDEYIRQLQQCGYSTNPSYSDLIINLMNKYNLKEKVANLIGIRTEENTSMVIFLDPGHGGKDPGAIGNNLQEKDLTLKISLYQKKRFNDHGIQVIMSRENDSTVDLDERMQKGRKSGAKISISNHINAGGGTGAEVWRSVKFNTGWGERIINEFIGLGCNIHGQGVKTKLSKKYPNYDYFAMNNTHPVQPIIIEYFFIDSNDAQKYAHRWQELAEAVVKATVEYLGVRYISPNDMVKEVLMGLFRDVKDGYAKESIERLAKLGLVKGDENGNFRPEEPLTREQLAVVIDRLLKYLGK